MTKTRLTDDEMISEVYSFIDASLTHLPPGYTHGDDFDLSLGWFCFGAVLKISERNILEDEHHRYDTVLRGILEKIELLADHEAAVKQIRSGPPKQYAKFLNIAWKAFGAYQHKPDEQYLLALKNELEATRVVVGKNDIVDPILKDESIRLSRPCLFLRESNSSDNVIGYWGGDGIVQAPSKLWRHVCSVNCEWFASVDIPLRGWLSVYISDRSNSVRAFSNERCSVTSIRTGVPLVGVTRSSVPPLQAICHFGGKSVDDWLKARGIGRRDYDAFELPELDANYTKLWQAECPLYNDDADVVLGGWHLQWPDGKRYDKRPGRLCLTTFRDAEPWIEVWCDESGSLKCFARMT